MAEKICTKCFAEGSFEEAMLAEAYQRGYDQGREDQKKIDIDMAYEWLSEHLMDYCFTGRQANKILTDFSSSMGSSKEPEVDEKTNDFWEKFLGLTLFLCFLALIAVNCLILLS